MSVPGSEKCEGPEDKVAGDPIWSNDKATGTDRILDQDLAVFGPGDPGHQFGLGHAGIHLLVPADIPESPSGEHTGFF